MASLFSLIRLGHSLAPAASSILPTSTPSSRRSSHERPSSSPPRHLELQASTTFVPVTPSWPPSGMTPVSRSIGNQGELEAAAASVVDARMSGPSSSDSAFSSHVYPPPPPALPPYVEDPEDPSPAYDPINRNPDVLAKHVHRLGFFFPLLWIFNIIILLQPLYIWEGDESVVDRAKTRDERREEVAIMRRVELYWARKSAVAFAIFIFLLVIAIVLAVKLSAHHTTPIDSSHKELADLLASMVLPWVQACDNSRGVGGPSDAHLDYIIGLVV
ncbi:hypothetical protein DL93DRAFT_2095772 [Clavulina sp. PMI_390]|nr:hypothetical protein DL93DRAFT_2095772 [Clavulina sp. PMI_390]